jgi:hypothetical protein
MPFRAGDLPLRRRRAAGQNDEGQVQRRFMDVEAMGDLLTPPPTDETLQLPPQAA